MAKLKVQGSATGTGTVTLVAPTTDSTRTITLPDGDISLGVGIDDNATSTAITIDASENVGIGTSSPDSALHVYKQTNDRSARFQRLSTQYVDMYQTSGINSLRSIGKNFEISTEDSNDLVLATNSIERARVLSSGGISFNGDTAAANALDDYEEGTWTVTLSSEGGTITGTGTGSYTKIGNLVSISGDATVSSVSSPNGSFQISGFPYSVVEECAGSVRSYGYTSDVNNVIFSVSSGRFEKFSGTTTQNLAPYVAGGTYVAFQATYKTN